MTAENPVLREVTLTLPMAPDMEVMASKTATAVAESVRMSPDKIDEVRLAVVEACINAFEHSRASNRVLFLSFAVLAEARTEGEPGTLEIRVRDEGIGFAPQGVEPPRMAEKLKAERKRGWGLQIIQGLMDQVEIQSGTGGTTVVMRKRIERDSSND
jgi:serine/threonine-protein kinase RsbW